MSYLKDIIDKQRLKRCLELLKSHVATSVNGNKPDSNGAVNVDVGVKTIDSITPDEDGNVKIPVATDEEVEAGEVDNKYMTPANTLFAINKRTANFYNSVADMKSDKKLKAGMTACTLGYYEPNDGGAGTYIIRAKQDGDVDDGGSLHEISSKLVAELVVENGTVRPEQFGAKGDGVTDDSTAIMLAIRNANLVLFKNEIYYLEKEVLLQDIKISLLGNQTILKNAALNFKNSLVSIKGITFKDSKYNAIVGYSTDFYVDNCIFENIGIATNLNVTSQGCGMYLNGTYQLRFCNNKTSNTHGHGALFIMGDVNVNIDNNIFLESDYRAIIFYKTTNAIGIVQNNHIQDNGKNLSNKSGVGCNGIYSTGTPNVHIINNRIINVVENAIEGRYASIVGNFINGTGVDNTKPTSSVEGIFVSSNCIVKNNIIKNTAGHSISYTSTNTISSIVIDSNITENAATGYSIYLNSYGSSKEINKCKINNNIVDGKISLIGANSNNNILSNNKGGKYADYTTFLGMLNLEEFSVKTDITTFETQTLGSLVAKNATVTYTQDEDNTTIANISFSTNGQLYKNIPRIFKDYKYCIEVLFKGEADIQLFNGATFIKNTGIGSDEFTVKRLLIDSNNTGDNFNFKIKANNATVEIKYVKEYILNFI